PPGQHDVEDDQIVGLPFDEQLERAVAIGGGLHGVPFFRESLPDEACDLSVVLYDENTHGLSGSSYLQLPRIASCWKAGRLSPACFPAVIVRVMPGMTSACSSWSNPCARSRWARRLGDRRAQGRSEEQKSELQSTNNIGCRLLL